MRKMNRGELSDYYELLRFIVRVLRFVGRTLFDWRGRVGRKAYFVVVGALWFWGVVCHEPMMDYLWNRSIPDDLVIRQQLGVDRRAYYFLGYAIPILFSIVRVVVTYKRLHDFNARGWWVLVIPAEYVLLIPALAASIELNVIVLLVKVAFFIVCGAIKGTDGANRYGEKPAL